MKDWKSWLESKTIWSALLAVAPVAAGWLGFDVNAVLADILTLVGTVGAIYFRVTATKQIGSAS